MKCEHISYEIIFFFFFQAEDGIRDYKVTGVQTCALPISAELTHRAILYVILHHALKIKLYCICDQLDRRLVQVNAVCSCDERQWMNLQAFGQCLNNANARYLMALLNSAHVTPAGCHQHVLLRQTAQGTQLSKRVAKVGSSGNMFARLHRLDFRPVRPKRPRPTSLI